MAIGQGPAVPDGRSPNARAGKRPRQDADASPARGPGALSVVELATAVLQLQPELKHTQDAVEWNGNLLNALITRVNTLEAWNNFVVPKIARFKGGIIEFRD